MPWHRYVGGPVKNTASTNKGAICLMLTSLIYNIHNRLATLQKSEIVTRIQVHNVAIYTVLGQNVIHGMDSAQFTPDIVTQSMRPA